MGLVRRGGGVLMGVRVEVLGCGGKGLVREVWGRWVGK